jgi:hypothetical protein
VRSAPFAGLYAGTLKPNRSTCEVFVKFSTMTTLVTLIPQHMQRRLRRDFNFRPLYAPTLQFSASFVVSDATSGGKYSVWRVQKLQNFKPILKQYKLILRYNGGCTAASSWYNVLDAACELTSSKYLRSEQCFMTSV